MRSFQVSRPVSLVFVACFLVAAYASSVSYHLVCVPQQDATYGTMCKDKSYRVVSSKETIPKSDSDMRKHIQELQKARPSKMTFNHLDQLRVTPSADALTHEAMSGTIQDQLMATESVVASATFADVIDNVGWSSFVATTNGSFADISQTHAAGFLEGVMTYTRMTQSFMAHNQTLFDQSNYKYSDLTAWLDKQRSWFRTQIALNPKDPFWQAVEIIDSHITGVTLGYTETAIAVTGQPPKFDVMVWNQRADIEDVLDAISGGVESCWLQPPEKYRRFERKRTHCSVLLSKLTSFDGYADFAVAHNTWDDFRSMLRVWKHYKFMLRLPSSKEAVEYRNQLRQDKQSTWQSPSSSPSSSSSLSPSISSSKKSSIRADKVDPHIMMLSSYPGIIQSIDDFYMLPRKEQRLIITETTNSICDSSLYKKITHEALMTWQRVLVANLLADGGETWTKIAMTHNSGSYNNQFMVIDAKAFPKNLCLDQSKCGPIAQSEEDVADLIKYKVNVPAIQAMQPHGGVEGHPSSTNGEPLYSLPSEFLWIVEQYPGGSERGSVSSVVNERGYWPSYNRPYFKSVFDTMGFAMAQLVRGDYYSYDKTVRALIFARNATRIGQPGPGEQGGIPALKQLMRYNDYKNDPISKGDPTWAIAARYDLLPESHAVWALDGATDVKMTSVRGIMGGSLGPVEPNSTSSNTGLAFKNTRINTQDNAIKATAHSKLDMWRIFRFIISLLLISFVFT